jgi:hypothetical protein
VFVSSPVVALDEASMLAEWVKSTREAQTLLAEDVIKRFVSSGGYEELLLEAKTARKRSTAELSEFTVACMNRMDQAPADDPAMKDIKIPIGDLMAACIETSLYN